MKKIAVSMRNRFFADSVMFMLERAGDFRPVRIEETSSDKIILECRATNPEILLLDVTPTSEETMVSGRLKMIKNLREILPNCKIAFFCDEVAHPEQAHETMRAKQEGFIDTFFYASVTGEYFSAALNAM